MGGVIALIPARSGSKGVPHKNIKTLGGRPLLEWAIKACLKSELIDRVIVSTDSLEYADLSKKLGAEVPFLRPAEISGDRSTDYDFILHALDWFAAHGGEPELLVHIRPTTPFRAPHLIDDAVNMFRNTGQATALRSVHEMSESAYKTFEINTEGRLKRLGAESTALDSANNARQQFPATFQANGYVDVLSARFIRSHRLIHGDSVIPFTTPMVVEVDTQDDFAHLEFLLERNPEIFKQLFS
jgi:CMP-N,N'-diacetyllegionaminic acid synthase